MKNVISKIFIAFLVISFVFFGISSFLLGGGDSWVAKVGGKKISYAALQKSMRIQRDVILRSNPNNVKASQYVNSQRFTVDVLSKLVNQEMLKKLGEKYGVNGNKALIFNEVARDKSFHKGGKFDRKYFKFFLAQNGLDEQSYIELIQNEVVNAMVVNSLSMTSPVNAEFVKKVAILKGEKRYADVLYITKRNIRRVKAPKNADLEAMYEKNKKNFILPESRKISYMILKKSDILGRVRVSNREALAFYAKNKENYKKAERRDFYHIAFNEKKKAQKFAKKVKKSQDKEGKFLKLGRDQKKTEKQLIISGVSRDDMIKSLADSAFSLKKGEVSKVLKSDLGFHVLLFKDARNNGYRSFSEVKKQIKDQLLNKKREDIFEKKIAAIDELLLSKNSLLLLKKKFAPKSLIKSTKIIKNQAPRSDVARLKDFVENAFTSKEGQASTLTDSGDVFYALKVLRVNESRQQNFKEVKKILKKSYIDKRETEAIKELAKKIAEEVRKNPGKIKQIAARKHLSFRANQKFNRETFLEFQGQKIPYSDKFTQELFALKIGKSTNYYQDGAKKFKVATLKRIKKPKVGARALQKYRNSLSDAYRAEFIESFNAYMQGTYKIDVNKKLLDSLKQEE